ncbi:MAG: hypothetical protein ABSC64_17615 [Candidatus Korobacteraceae bacterium]
MFTNQVGGFTVPGDGTWVQVITVTVPAGSYAFSGSEWGFNVNDGRIDLQCAIRPASSPPGFGDVLETVQGHYAGTMTTITEVANVGVATQFALWCATASSPQPSYTGAAAHLRVIQAESVTMSP